MEDGVVQGFAFLALLALATGVWVISVIAGKACVVDSMWSIVVAGYPTICYWFYGGPSPLNEPRYQLLMGILWIWSFRLSLFLTYRNWGHSEDRRYQVFRKKNPQSFWWMSLFTVFWLQSVLSLLLSMPLAVLPTFDRSDDLSISPWSYIGVAIFTFGFLYETTADFQLYVFKKANPDGRYSGGLWRYSKHPNYFGEMVVWLGIGAYCCPYKGGVLALLSFFFVTLLISKVSGPPMQSKKHADTNPEKPTFIPDFRL